MEELIDEFNELLRGQEDQIIVLVNNALEKAFNRLLQRIYDQLQSGQFRLAEREARVLELIPPLLPDQTDELTKIFEQLLQYSTGHGLDLAARLSEAVVQAPISASIPTAAVVEAAKRSRGYLERHGRVFAEEVSESIAQGLIEGRSVKQMTSDFKTRFNVTKSRAEVIVRTESLRAYNEASRAFYAQNNVQTVIYYATADDRTCPFCAAQAGRVFKLNAIRVPRHPNCRCYLAPYATNQYESTAPYDKNRRRHRSEVHRYAKSRGVELDDGPAYFEQSQPLPVRKDGRNESQN